MTRSPITVVFVRPRTPPPTPEGVGPVTPEALARALNTLALCVAREGLLTPDARAEKAGEIATFVRKHLAVVDQAARQWPACTPAFPSLEEALAGAAPLDRTCGECGCWRRHYDAWKKTMAPPWWPNAEEAGREELEAWVAQRLGAVQRGARVHPAPG